ncbi:MAG: gfo/Idh/MocA family oxidoreductase [Cyanobacteria bacterium QH_7_48_89]|jgi:glucose-fructose oxidoreductase|nr:MAG: gfo/Idh/MocA family oxidoreductase [Cyanobacteria bacterium QH_7_48_89]
MTPASNPDLSAPGEPKVRYAVVGLGWIAQAAVLPAFANALENSQLVALVSGDSTKHQELSKRYGVNYTYSYEQYEDCLHSGKIDAVFIALPNHLHREYAVRAAEAGIHVLCEKPMAVTQQDCEAMIRACADNSVKLMIAYRLHFEKANMQAVEIVQSGQIGEPRIFHSAFTQQVVEGNVRLFPKTMGGGTVPDMGIYCINAARYLFQDEPIEVSAFSANLGEPRFSEVDEMTSAVLRFRGERVATYTCSFGTASVSNYQVVGTKGDLRVDPAYIFGGEIKHQLTIDAQTTEYTFEPQDQFAAELIYFSDCILKSQTPVPSGVEGLADVRIIEAIEHSAKTGNPVQLGEFERQERPTKALLIPRPAVDKPELIRAAPPWGK